VVLTVFNRVPDAFINEGKKGRQVLGDVKFEKGRPVSAGILSMKGFGEALR
jgi:hypothetical protein